MIDPFVGSLEDSHILELADRITDEHELMQLGVKVLKLPEYKIRQASSNNNSIHSAAHDVLSIWFKQQTNRHKAYTSLITSLRRCQMNQLAAQLEKWVMGTDQSSQPSSEGKQMRVLSLL